MSGGAPILSAFWFYLFGWVAVNCQVPRSYFCVTALLRWNLCAVRLSVPVLPNAFSAGLCSRAHSRSQGLFLTTERNLVPWSLPASLIWPRAAADPSLHLLWAFHVKYVVVLCLWSFALSPSTFSRLIHAVACICCIPFYDWMMFHSMDRRHFVYLLVCWWTFRLATMGSAAVDICVQIYVWV